MVTMAVGTRCIMVTIAAYIMYIVVTMTIGTTHMMVTMAAGTMYIMPW
jgi:hypothetical protein